MSKKGCYLFWKIQDGRQKNKIFAILSKSIRRTAVKQPSWDPLWSGGETTSIYFSKNPKWPLKTQNFRQKNVFCDFLKKC